MRLYLSSFRLGNRPEALLKLLGNNRRVAVIANACDFRDTDTRRERLEREFEDLQGLGLEPAEIDLRDYFDGSFTTQDLSGFELVWVRGGNAFNLLRAMRRSGFDKAISSLLAQDALVYGGYSAGGCVLAPALRGIELCDPTDEIPAGYQAEIEWNGLDIIPYMVVPHYRSDHPESKAIDNVVAYLQQHELPYKTLHDGEAIVINGDNTELHA